MEVVQEVVQDCRLRSRSSQAREKAQWRSTVASEIPSCWEHWGIVILPKNFSSTNWAWVGC